MHNTSEDSARHSSEAEQAVALQKPAPDAPREDWLRWHLSRRPPRLRQHYDVIARILDGG
jgi:hypothetical protein